jgi:DNA repair protein RecO (recombination protein O)
MIVRTDAVVLKSMKYRETSRIVTLYTRSYGKVSVVAKGARDMKSKFGASLEPMTHISAILYKKPHRELHLLSKTDILGGFRRLHSDFDCMNIGYAVVDLLNSVMHGEEEHPAVFHLLLDTLTALNEGTKNLLNVLYYFEIRLAALLGFEMVLDRCSLCGTVITEGISGRLVFNPTQGSVMDERCGGNSDRWIPVSLQSVLILRHLSHTETGSVAGIDISDSCRKEIESVLRGHFGSHIDATKKLHSITTLRTENAV